MKYAVTITDEAEADIARLADFLFVVSAAPKSSMFSARSRDRYREGRHAMKAFLI